MKLTPRQIAEIAQRASRKVREELLREVPRIQFAPGDELKVTYLIRFTGTEGGELVWVEDVSP